MSPPAVFFSDDLIGEIFSALPVKSVMRFRCISKSCDTLISDPVFVKLHLKRWATRNLHFLLITDHSTEIKGESPYGSDDEYDTRLKGYHYKGKKEYLFWVLTFIFHAHAKESLWKFGLVYWMVKLICLRTQNIPIGFKMKLV